MKSLLVSSLLFGLAAAAVVAPQAKKITYDGYRVVRVTQSKKVDSLIAENSLPTWSKEHGNIDVLLPPSKHQILDSLSPVLMHDDLGASIANEEAVSSTYLGSHTFLNPRAMIILTL